jgi:hypothetical protein
MTDLRTAALRALDALGAARDTTYSETLYVQFELAISTLKAALAQPEDKSQAAFEHWVETVEATQGCAISRNAVADELLTVTAAQVAHAEAVENLTVKESLTVEPTAWLHVSSTEPNNRHLEWTKDRKGYRGDWIKIPLYTPHRPWMGLTDEERDYFKACGFVGVSKVEEVLRSRNGGMI